MKFKGKVGAMNKFPRVIKGKPLEDWQDYLAKNIGEEKDKLASIKS